MRAKCIDTMEQIGNPWRWLFRIRRRKGEAEESLRCGLRFTHLSLQLPNSRSQHSCVDFRVTWIHMYEVSWCEYDRIPVDDFRRRDGRAAGWEADCLSEASAHQLHQKRALVPSLESGPTQVYIVNFDSVLDILHQTLKEVLSLQLIKRSVNQVHTQDASSLLLEEVARVAQIDMQQYVVGLPTWLLPPTSML